MPDERTVLITGATGFVGRRLTAELLSRGKKVRLLVRNGAPEGVEGIETVTGDLLNPLSLDHAFDGIDTVYGMGYRWKEAP